MKIAVMGAGWYGCVIAQSLMEIGHDVHVYDKADELFGGASGANPARLHLGFHYPRSLLTRYASQSNNINFMERFGHFTRGIRTNIYAVAAEDSLVDFPQYVSTLAGEIDFVEIEPDEFGLQNVEGAVLTAERHILVNKVRDYFEGCLGDNLHLGVVEKDVAGADVVVDCTFSAMVPDRISRFEPCVTFILDGPWDWAVTIMDGPFPSVYPWYEDNTVSLTSAKWTPLSKELTSYDEAVAMLDDFGPDKVSKRFDSLINDMARFYPDILEIGYEFREARKAVRAMPRSAADSRLMSVRWDPERNTTIRVIAGKIDAVLDAADQVKELIT